MSLKNNMLFLKEMEKVREFMEKKNEDEEMK